MIQLQFPQSWIHFMFLTGFTSIFSICTVRQEWTESGTAGSPYPELILAVFGPLVERPVIVEAADVVYAVEALDPLRHSLQLRHIRDV